MMQHIYTQLLACLTQQQSVVLCTLAKVTGSAPQHEGAKFLVYKNSEDHIQTLGTIGGGHLEYDITAHAILKLNLYDAHAATLQPPNQLLYYNLSANLGQCCGGVVWVLTELIHPCCVAYHTAAPRIIAGELVQKNATPMHTTFVYALNGVSHTQQKVQLNIEHHQPNGSKTTHVVDDVPNWHFLHTLTPPQFKVCVFGAGHVGKALVQLLQICKIQTHWFDNRENLCSADTTNQATNTVQPSNTKVEPTYEEFLTDTLDQLTHNTAIVILTHDHALDFELCQAALKQHRFIYIGLIGSQSKKIKFEKRLAHKGFSQQDIDKIHCPIGVTGIKSKQPEHVALSICAQLLQLQCKNSVF